MTACPLDTPIGFGARAGGQSLHRSGAGKDRETGGLTRDLGGRRSGDRRAGLPQPCRSALLGDLDRVLVSAGVGRPLKRPAPLAVQLYPGRGPRSGLREGELDRVLAIAQEAVPGRPLARRAGLPSIALRVIDDSRIVERALPARRGGPGPRAAP